MELGDISDYIAAVLVIVGWVILYRQSLTIRRREEMLDGVNRISATIERLMSLCREYYSPANTSHISYTSAQIKGEFNLLSRYILLLKGAGLQVNGTGPFVKFKMLATGSHFETTQFLQQLAIPNWEQDLMFSGLELKYQVEAAYFRWLNRKLGLSEHFGIHGQVARAN